MPITRAALQKKIYIEGYVGKALGSLLVSSILKKKHYWLPKEYFLSNFKGRFYHASSIFSPSCVQLAFSILPHHHASHVFTSQQKHASEPEPRPPNEWTPWGSTVKKKKEHSNIDNGSCKTLFTALLTVLPWKERRGKDPQLCCNVEDRGKNIVLIDLDFYFL